MAAITYRRCKDELDGSNSNCTCMPNISIHGSGRRQQEEIMHTKAECDNCGWVHGTPKENRAFRWCRRIRGTVCDQCCKKCEYNDDWHCRFDPIGKARMYELTYANNDDERRISKFEDRLRQTKNESSREVMNNIIEQIKDRISERDKEYESIHSGEVILTKE